MDIGKIVYLNNGLIATRFRYWGEESVVMPATAVCYVIFLAKYIPTSVLRQWPIFWVRMERIHVVYVR